MTLFGLVLCSPQLMQRMAQIEQGNELQNVVSFKAGEMGHMLQFLVPARVHNLGNTLRPKMQRQMH